MIRCVACSIACAGYMLASGSAGASAAFSFSAFDFPGGTSTTAFGINAAGQIVGSYVDASDDRNHGFKRLPSGAFISVDYPKAVATEATGINDRGDIVGTFTDEGTRSHVFLRMAAGAFSIIDLPEARDAYASGINNSEQIVGWFKDANKRWHIFKRSADGVVTIFDYPGASDTFAGGISETGAIVGSYYTPSRAGAQTFAFLTTGKPASVNFPTSLQTLEGGGSSVICPDTFATAVIGDVQGPLTIVGGLKCAHFGDHWHGFIWTRPKPTFGTVGDESYLNVMSKVEYTVVDAPGAVATEILGINKSGQIVGYLIDSTGTQRGFVASQTQ